jgi:hypothetical protein
MNPKPIRYRPPADGMRPGLHCWPLAQYEEKFGRLDDFNRVSEACHVEFVVEANGAVRFIRVPERVFPYAGGRYPGQAETAN